MHSALTRGNHLTSLATTVIGFVLFAIALTTFIIPASLNPASLKINNLSVARGLSKHYNVNKAVEYAKFNFDLRADLKPLFNWNTKQLFVYLQAEYSTNSHSINKVVVWDRIITTRRYAKINIADGKLKYKFNEITDTFRNVTATFTLHYDRMPHVGFLTSASVVSTEPIKFPSLPEAKKRPVM